MRRHSVILANFRAFHLRGAQSAASRTPIEARAAQNGQSITPGRNPNFSNLTKSLQTRIHELTASIDVQKTELAAYEQILQIETAKASSTLEESPSDAPSETNPSPPQVTSVSPTVELAHLTTTGNKTTLVADIVRAHGSLGASPNDVDRFFSARKIKRGKSLIYNTLSYLVAQKKLLRRDGRYFVAAIAPVAQSQRAPPNKLPTLSN